MAPNLADDLAHPSPSAMAGASATPSWDAPTADRSSGSTARPAPASRRSGSTTPRRADGWRLVAFDRPGHGLSARTRRRHRRHRRRRGRAGRPARLRPVQRAGLLRRRRRSPWPPPRRSGQRVSGGRAGQRLGSTRPARRLRGRGLVRAAVRPGGRPGAGAHPGAVHRDRLVVAPGARDHGPAAGTPLEGCLDRRRVGSLATPEALGPSARPAPGRGRPGPRPAPDREPWGFDVGHRRACTGARLARRPATPRSRCTTPLPGRDRGRRPAGGHRRG